MASRHTRFDLPDPVKEGENRRKHQMDFGPAREMLADPEGDLHHDEDFDDAHSSEDEDRWITTGPLPSDPNLVLVVVWTERPLGTRIISARKATPQERRSYANRHHR